MSSYEPLNEVLLKTIRHHSVVKDSLTAQLQTLGGHEARFISQGNF